MVFGEAIAALWHHVRRRSAPSGQGERCSPPSEIAIVGGYRVPPLAFRVPNELGIIASKHGLRPRCRFTHRRWSRVDNIVGADGSDSRASRVGRWVAVLSDVAAIGLLDASQRLYRDWRGNDPDWHAAISAAQCLYAVAVKCGSGLVEAGADLAAPRKGSCDPISPRLSARLSQQWRLSRPSLPHFLQPGRQAGRDRHRMAVNALAPASFVRRWHHQARAIGLYIVDLEAGELRDARASEPATSVNKPNSRLTL